MYGAYYITESTEGIETAHLRDLAVAVTEASAADVEEVTVLGIGGTTTSTVDDARDGGAYIIDADLQIPDNLTVNFRNDIIIEEGVTVTFAAEAGSTINTSSSRNLVYVEGKLVDNGGIFDRLTDNLVYEVMKLSEDEETTTYTSLAIALDESNPNETIQLNGTVTIDENLEIPVDVTVVTDTDTNIGAAQYSLIIDGAQLTINGTLELSGTKGIQLAKEENVTGSIVLNNIIRNAGTGSFMDDATPNASAQIPGAYFSGQIGDDEEGTAYVTSAAVAAANSANATTDITIYGRVAMGAVSFDAGEDNQLTVKIDNTYDGVNNKNATTGTVTLVGGTVFDMSAGAFTGTVTDGANTIDFNKSEGMIIGFETSEAVDGTVTSDMVVSANVQILGGVTVSAGEVTTNSDMKFSNVEATVGTLEVASGAILNVENKVTLAAPAAEFNGTNLPTDNISEFIGDRGPWTLPSP